MFFCSHKQKNEDGVCYIFKIIDFRAVKTLKFENLLTRTMFCVIICSVNFNEKGDYYGTTNTESI